MIYMDIAVLVKQVILGLYIYSPLTVGPQLTVAQVSVAYMEGFTDQKATRRIWDNHWPTVQMRDILIEANRTK